MSDDSAPQTDGIVSRLREKSPTSRREFLGRSAQAGVGALALGVVGSNTALAHDADDDDVSDVDVLNYALTLEHLEHQFYEMGLEHFSQGDFRCADAVSHMSEENRNEIYVNLEDIEEHEQTHVETLTEVIQNEGGDPVEAACYDFGVEDADDFLALARVFENTGVSAYDGAIALISEADYITAGATIATVEGRHAAYLNHVTGEDPFPEPFDDTATMEEVKEKVGDFIVECE